MYHIFLGSHKHIPRYSGSTTAEGRSAGPVRGWAKEGRPLSSRQGALLTTDLGLDTSLVHSRRWCHG